MRRALPANYLAQRLASRPVRNFSILGIMRSCGAADVQGTVVDSKRPIEADLIDAVRDPKPPNSRRAIRLWHSCVDVYISNPQTTVVARSDHLGPGRKPGRGVAETHARA
jgi:hypothetical protein